MLVFNIGSTSLHLSLLWTEIPKKNCHDYFLFHCRIAPSNKFAATHLNTWVATGHSEGLAQEHNTMPLARAQAAVLTKDKGGLTQGKKSRARII